MGATFSRLKTWIAETLTASDLNAEFDNIINNLTPAGLDDESANLTAMQATTDPYPGSVASLSTSLQGELQRIRYILKQITGQANWYVDPTITLAENKTRWVPAELIIPTTTAGCAALAKTEYGTNDINLQYLAFDGASKEYAEFTLWLPTQWNVGTLKSQFLWSSATGSTAADTVEWEVAAGFLTDNVTIDTALGTAQVISDTLLADNGTKMQMSAVTPAITVAGTASRAVHFKISRNVGGTDSMTEDAWLFGVCINYQEISATAW